MFKVVLVISTLYFLKSNALSFNKAAGKHNGHSKLQMSVEEVVGASYNLAAGAAVVGTVCGGLENFKGPTGKFFGAGAIAFTLFGGFLAFQTTTLRFKFDETNFSLGKTDNSKLQENIVVGGENSWSYDSFVNWDFLPNEEFPILVYFKETQTPKEQWVEAPIVVDSLPGQAHFFPAIADVQQLKKNFIKYGCKNVKNVNPVTLKAPSKLTL
jgi:hypothetical protein